MSMALYYLRWLMVVHAHQEVPAPTYLSLLACACSLKPSLGIFRYHETSLVSKDPINLPSTLLSLPIDLSILYNLLLHLSSLSLLRRLLHLLARALSILSLDLSRLLATLFGRSRLGGAIGVPIDLTGLGGELLLDDTPGVGSGARVSEAG